MSPFHLLVILAGLFLIVFLILELLSPATFRQNTKVFAACQIKAKKKRTTIKSTIMRMIRNGIANPVIIGVVVIPAVAAPTSV